MSCLVSVPGITTENALMRVSYAANPSQLGLSVTVDSLTNRNVIVWEKPVTDMIVDFLVYKETDEAGI